MNVPTVRSEYHGLVRSEVFPLLPPKIERLLDVGGGIGATASAIKAKFAVPYAGVIDQVAEEAGAGIALDFKEAIDLRDMSAIEQIGERHGPFDCILCLDVLEHLVDPWSVVEALGRQLKVGGSIVVSIPNVQHHSVVRGLLGGNWPYDPKGGLLDETHLRFFVKRTAVEMMTPPGLKLEEIGYTGLGPGSKAGLVDKLTGGLFRGFLVYQYLIRVRRID